MNKQIVDEAAEWFVEFNSSEPDLETKRNFTAWLKQSPEHVRAYLELLPIWDGADSVSCGSSADELIDVARRSANVLPLPVVSLSTERAESTTWSARSALLPRFSPRRAVLSLVALLACIAVVLFNHSHITQDLVYATEVGEMRTFHLSDGSAVEINTASRVRVSFTRHARLVELLDGQAFFQVAKDPERPFCVASGQTRVCAVGTQFDVYRKAGGTIVTVVEGRVFVDTDYDRDAPPAASQKTPSPSTRTPVFLTAGEQMTVTASESYAPTRADTQAATAWTQHRLVFDSVTLPTVAEEFNRYNTRKIVIDPSAPSDFRLSGSFSSTDPSSLLGFLKQQPGVAVHEMELEIRIAHD